MSEFKLAKPEVLVSGKRTFRLQVPYKLISTGQRQAKPLIVYLHGFAQNMEWAERTFSQSVESVEAYHLFIQAPHMLIETFVKRKKEAFSWYFFGDSKERYLDSMEHAAEFVQEIVDQMLGMIEVNKRIYVGYSMGAYLAGYFTVTRPENVEAVLMISGRLKLEEAKSMERLLGTQFFAVHGKMDEEVDVNRQREQFQSLSKNGLENELVIVEKGKHALEGELLEVTLECLSRIASAAQDGY